VHYDAYEYLANHHSYKRDEHPTVKITYNLSPLQVRVAVRPVAAATVVGSASGSTAVGCKATEFWTLYWVFDNMTC
jgi:hypothetical protein